MKIGMLSGGGDAPGINAVIRAVVKKGILIFSDDFIGIKEGWRGLLEKKYIPLNLDTVAGIASKGGSILGNSRTNPEKRKRGFETILKNVREAELDALIVIGGDDTLGVAYKLFKMGVNCVGVPKTIDNNLPGTDFTFGFQTAVAVATEALDRLRTTAEAHRRVMILEVMGRRTGHIALHAGIAGSADMILVPEKPFKIKEICNCVKQRITREHPFGVIVVAEGAKPEDAKVFALSKRVDEFGHPQLGGVGYFLAKKIEEETDLETRVVILGHLQRGGSPVAFDRILATRLGFAAVDLVHQGKFGEMVSLRGDKITSVALKKVVGRQKNINLKLYNEARVLFC